MRVDTHTNSLDVGFLVLGTGLSRSLSEVDDSAVITSTSTFLFFRACGEGDGSERDSEAFD